MPTLSASILKQERLSKMLSYQKASTSDVEEIYCLTKRLIDDYEDKASIDYDKVLSWVRGKIEASIGEYTAVYKDGAKVGYYHFYKNDNGKYELDDLYVFDEYRNNGIGTQIIKECISSVDEAVMLYVFAKNVRAISLYKSLGFKITKTVHETRYIMQYNKKTSQI